jgi:hypothetical protein
LSIIRNWKTLLAIVVILFLSLFGLFRLIGTLNSPMVISESIVAKAVSWNVTRPNVLGARVELNRTVNGTYEIGGISVRLDTKIFDYFPTSNGPPAGGNSYFVMRLSASANASVGYIYSMSLRLSATDAGEFIVISRDPGFISVSNLRLGDISYQTASGNEAYVAATGVNQTNSCKMELWTYWAISSNSNMNYLETTHFDAVFFNGTAFNKVSLPLNGEVLPY